jgi:hypothetical protein
VDIGLKFLQMKRPPTGGHYGIFQTVVSICWHLGHTKVSSSWPGRSGSAPNSAVAVPHWEHLALNGIGIWKPRERYEDHRIAYLALIDLMSFVLTRTADFYEPHGHIACGTNRMEVD